MTPRRGNILAREANVNRFKVALKSNLAPNLLYVLIAEFPRFLNYYLELPLGIVDFLFFPV